MSEATVWSEARVVAQAIFDGVTVRGVPDGAGFEARWSVDWDALRGPAADALHEALDSMGAPRPDSNDERVLRLVSDVMDGMLRCDEALADEDDPTALAGAVFEWMTEDDGWDPPVDVYTGDLFAWAARYPHLVEAWLDEVGWERGTLLGNVIAAAQDGWMREIADALVLAVVDAGESILDE
jgi:hypothetical protein